ncbi:hypothetical protein CLI64_06215 [Nostoc sp. CENA543]|uniref:DUF4386 domain-containing protein n=1 Tax=Nostoc sp. CENA543 TaxID=1869241 RepID=UPI000CA1CD57|nr:DUF4386 domain-containing protein [Nostoc sp. CENA543]AUT00011.1 hypothetical protein CLI64_06215 [Nostoc sp. CENA543]
MSRANLVKTTGILFIVLVVLLNIPYALLIHNFEYDDILREPVDYVLQKFQSGGAGLILTWFIFGLAALLFIPASTLLHQIMAQKDTPYLKTATLMGALSGILQSVGLMRWVFVVPVLANLYNNPTASKTTRETISVIYQVVHQYGGVVIGEYLGQTLLVFWTLGVGIAMLHSPLFKSWVAYFGLMTVPLLVLGQSELLTTVIPASPVWEVTPVGFILWEIWILIIGISSVRTPQHRIALRK